jgi:hypothetical protein
MNRWLATILLLMAALVAGCAPASTPAPATSGTPSAFASPSSAAEITASPSTTAAPSASGAAVPSPSPQPETFHIAWHRSLDPATPKSGDWGSMGWRGNVSWTKLGDLYVVPVYSEDRPVVWTSRDLLHWTKATLPFSAGETLGATAVTLGGPGLVAIGVGFAGEASIDAAWTSTDGRTWKRVSDPGLSAGQKWLLQAVADDLVTFTAGPVDVTMFPGKAIDAADVPVMVMSEEGLTAFVIPGAKRAVEIWGAIGTTAWRRVGVLPHSTGASVSLASHGPDGWFVKGCVNNCATNGWASRDGITWQTVTSLPGTLNAIVADGSGFIAVGDRNTGTGCAIAEYEVFGETWTSVDGRRWRRAPDQAQFNRATIQALIVKDGTLFGIGVRYPADGLARSTVWTADLPADSLATGPTSTPPPLGPVGCGP